jgi:hypothetical protein
VVDLLARTPVIPINLAMHSKLNLGMAMLLVKMGMSLGRPNVLAFVKWMIHRNRRMKSIVGRLLRPRIQINMSMSLGMTVRLMKVAMLFGRSPVFVAPNRRVLPSRDHIGEMIALSSLLRLTQVLSTRLNMKRFRNMSQMMTATSTQMGILFGLDGRFAVARWIRLTSQHRIDRWNPTGLIPGQLKANMPWNMNPLMAVQLIPMEIWFGRSEALTR